MTGSVALTIFAADDHPIVRAGVRLMIEKEEAFKLIGEAADVAGTMAAVERDAPDLLILDLWMGGNDGVELVRRIRTLAPHTRILIYSMNDERVLGPRVLRAGAAGYVMKDRGLDELLTAVRMVASGRRYMSPALAGELTNLALRMPRRVNGTRPSALAALTDRELQVFRLIGQGRTNAGIAEALNISPKTVRAHRENLKGKLRLANGAELVQRAVTMMKNRLI